MGDNVIVCYTGTDDIVLYDGVTSTELDSFTPTSTLTFGCTFDGTDPYGVDYTLTVSHYDGWTNTELGTFVANSDSNHAAGLSCDASLNFFTGEYIAASAPPLIIKYDGFSDTELLTVEHAGVNQMTGITHNGDDVFSTSYDEEVYQYEGETDTVRDSFTATTANASGLSTDGTDMYVCENNAPDELHQYDGMTDTEITSFTTANKTMFGVGWENFANRTAGGGGGDGSNAVFFGSNF